MNTRQICVRLRALGIPKQQTGEIISALERWTKCSGPEWTVEHIKQLKLEYISRLSGNPKPAPFWKHNPHDGLPSGVWHWLFKLSGKKAAFKVLNTLMVYSTLEAKEVTKKQREKFFSSMESQDQTGLDSRLKWPGPSRMTVDPCVNSTVFEVCTSPDKNAPGPEAYSIRQDDVFGQMLYFGKSLRCQRLYAKYPSAFAGVIPERLYMAIRDYVTMPYDNTPSAQVMDRVHAVQRCVGKIGLIQEPGYKLRAVAVPNGVLQAALQPLKRLVLLDLKLHFPTDCTHNQEEGISAVQNWLKEGKTCFSVDLSDATNLFPRPMQVHLLRQRYGKSGDQWNQRINLFDDVSSSEWYCVENSRITIHRFTRGQPLGLGPSFPVFALTHNVLVSGICRNLSKDPKDCFRILGDDIVISDPEVHRRYRKTLDNLGCKVSEPKTLVSSDCAEFAGKVITRDRIISTYKWHKVELRNFLAIAKEYGPWSTSLLTRTQRKMVDLISSIPEDLGGFGWNPKGLSLDERLRSETAQAMLERTLHEDVVVQYRPLGTLWNNLWKEVTTSTLLPRFRDKICFASPGIFQLGIKALMSYKPVEPTWFGVMDSWDNPKVQQSLALIQSELERNPSTPLDFVYVVQNPSDPKYMHPLWSKRYGVLYPVATNSIGDPRYGVNTFMCDIVSSLVRIGKLTEKQGEHLNRSLIQATRKRTSPLKRKVKSSQSAHKSASPVVKRRRGRGLH
jgi:hypothetical protein